MNTSTKPRDDLIVVYRSTALVFFWVLVGTVGIVSSVADGQQPSGDSTVDFTRWLQNKSYERFDYGHDGELKIHQVIQFGELAPQEPGCVLPIRVISFDVGDRSHAKGDAELSLSIECSSPHLVANILKFVGDSQRQHLEAKVIGDELAYPETPRDGMNLPDLHFSMKVPRGFLAVLGTKISVLVTGRTVSFPRSQSLGGSGIRIYEIHSEIRVGMFMIGIPVTRTGFSSRLIIDPINGPVEEILEHDDGTRTEIRAVTPPAPVD